MRQSSESNDPVAAELDWGPDAPDPGRRPRRWRDHRLAAVAGGLGGVALFASLAGEWASVEYPIEIAGTEQLRVTVSAATADGWGALWLVGALLLGTATLLAVAGPAHLRTASRAVGLALSGVLAGLLAAATVDISERGSQLGVLLTVSYIRSIDADVTLEGGLYAGYAALALLALALWLLPPGERTAGSGGGVAAAPGERTAGSGSGMPDERTAAPGEITVAPAEPLTYPDRRHEWR